jgi:hypothetical protein
MDNAGRTLWCSLTKCDLKKPIPETEGNQTLLIRESLSVGLSNASYDCPPGNTGFSSNAFVTALTESTPAGYKRPVFAGLFSSNGAGRTFSGKKQI